MPDQKVIKGSVIRITDASLPADNEFLLEIDPVAAKQIGASTYIEVDLTTPVSVNIKLPKIETLGGFLQYKIFCVDKAGTINKEFPINFRTPEVEKGETQQTILGANILTMQEKRQGVQLSPISNDSWFSMFGTNICDTQPEGSTYVVSGVKPSESEEEGPK